MRGCDKNRMSLAHESQFFSPCFDFCAVFFRISPDMLCAAGIRPCRPASASNCRKNVFFIVACLFRALRSIRQAVALLPACLPGRRQYAQLCAAMFSLRCEHTPRFFRYFAHLQRWRRLSGCGNVRSTPPCLRLRERTQYAPLPSG